MILNDLILKVLDKGLLLKVWYADENIRKFKIIGKNSWLKKYKLSVIDGIIVDILRMKATSLDITVDTIEYLFMPRGFDLRHFLTTSDNINHQKELFTGTFKRLTSILLDFNEYKNTLTSGLKSLSLSEIKDEYFVRFYPETLRSKKKKDAIQEIENDIIEKYFIVGGESKEPNAVPACTRIGLSHLLLDVQDKDLIACCKRRWFKIIQLERNNLVDSLKQQLKKTQKSRLKNKSKAISQLRMYIKILMNINFRILKQCNGIRDIISFWPNLMQPAPPYIYEH